jgi:hypothetical protein
MEEKDPLAFMAKINEENGFSKKEIRSLKAKIRYYYRRDNKRAPEAWFGEQLGTAFLWEKTRDGYDFWYKLDLRLYDLN